MCRSSYSSVVVTTMAVLSCCGTGCQPSPGNVTMKGVVNVELHKSPGTTAFADVAFADGVYEPMNLDVILAKTTTSTDAALDGAMSIDTLTTSTSSALVGFVNASAHRTPANRIGVYVVSDLRVKKLVFNIPTWCEDVRGIFVRSNPNNLSGHIFIENTDLEITLAHEMWHMLTGRADHAASGLGKLGGGNGDDGIYSEDVKLIYANASGKVTIIEE